MKKRLFQDLITETKLPNTFWKFFFLSIIIHGVMFYLLVNMRMEPVERVELKPDTARTVVNPQSSQSTSSSGAVSSSSSSSASNASPGAEASMGRSGLSAAAYAAGGEIVEPYSVSSGSEPVDLTGVSPAAKPVQYQYKAPQGSFNEDEFMKFYNKPFTDVNKKRESSFGVKKRTTTYPKIKGMIEKRELPPEQMVKIDEMVNYFYYDYPLPDDGEPFSITTEVAPCPWDSSRLLVHIGLQGKIVEKEIKEKKRVIATDMNLKVGFNPEKVKAYRLIGHAARKPKLGEVEDHWKKGKELHMGQSFTTLYEVIPVEDPAKPFEQSGETEKKESGEIELGTLKVAYKEPGSPKTWEVSQKIMELEGGEEEVSEDFIFSSVVAQFSMYLKNPEKKVASVLQRMLESARSSVGEDPTGQRAEFVKVLDRYIELIKDQ